ncbi:membrane protein [Nocardioides phosphati]|uniref:Membrane protein n=1 Tax=Nocardioides phosphati TaxID=1867775 RepID=A0ABQ2NBB6_9ACTN|nr:Bax inhibitor-1/YccA family protein [Nocardioides phosphati]GGO89771.1 membrane protein [Nocardioides phosphati]
MKSNNPIFNNNPAFNGQAGYGQGGYAQQAYPQGGYPPPPPGYGAPQYGAPLQAPQATRAMTIDDVVQKTGISLGVVLIAAVATWVGTGDVTAGDTSSLVALTSVGMFGGLIVGLICSFKRSMLSPALVLAYAAFQGLFMGGISKIYDAQFSTQGEPSIVFQAVLGTIFAGGGVLAAYKFFDIKIGDRFRRGVIAASFGFLGLGLLELVLSMFGHGMGFFGNGGMGLIFAIAGLAFGVVGLLLDFDMVENGLRAGVPEKFAWTAAFGLTASLVMVYFYLLRILAILQND